MREKKSILVLTDHFSHADGESIYPLIAKMSEDPLCRHIDIASRGNSGNRTFFNDTETTRVFAARASRKFIYDPQGKFFVCGTHNIDITNYDAIFLRIDRPFEPSLRQKLISCFKGPVINDPLGTEETGSKSFLVNFQDLCPPIKLCSSLPEILDFAQRFPIVLKPLESYGGKGLVLIDLDNDVITADDQQSSVATFLPELKERTEALGGYLAMKFLKNFSLGDKRIIVVNGEIMGAVLRLPPKESFICNLSRGGSAAPAEVDDRERSMAQRIGELLAAKGVVIFGFDTLVDDDGYRVLSEINTLNVGGLQQAEENSDRPVIKLASDLLWRHIGDLLP